MAKRRTARKEERTARSPRPSDNDLRGAAELLREAVKALTPQDAAGDRILFPRGIELVHLNLSVREGRIEIKVAGPGVAHEAALRTGEMFAAGDLEIGQKVPNQSETATVGAFAAAIVRDTAEFRALIKNNNADIVFKDEDPNPDSDHMMTKKLQQKVDTLAALVKKEWPGVKLRVTEAWDENNEHGTKSLHYEARAIDLTTFPVDSGKLGRLGRLAVNAGLEWVLYEDETHIHASMSK